jgi:hypothetical protein
MAADFAIRLAALSMQSGGVMANCRSSSPKA